MQAEGALLGARRAISAPERPQKTHPAEAELRVLLDHLAGLLQEAGQADLADLMRLWPALGQQVQQDVVERVWQAVTAKGQ